MEIRPHIFLNMLHANVRKEELNFPRVESVDPFLFYMTSGRTATWWERTSSTTRRRRRTRAKKLRVKKEVMVRFSQLVSTSGGGCCLKPQ
jgi:hypothetical protein